MTLTYILFPEVHKRAPVSGTIMQSEPMQYSLIFKCSVFVHHVHKSSPSGAPFGAQMSTVVSYKPSRGDQS